MMQAETENSQLQVGKVCKHFFFVSFTGAELPLQPCANGCCRSIGSLRGNTVPVGMLAF